ncbi:glycosyltransferase [Metabacillus fastidiosus]|uniref:glycosyltransferase n=1 Tax=Metabacillus fastidiosus TaxID=1458 RepID=UPI003D2866D0
MKTSIIILTYNKLDYTKQCIESIRQYTNKDHYEIIVIDNNSTDGTIEWLKNQDDIKKIFNQENLGFPKGCNQGIGVATGDNILLLNNDVVVTQDWLTNLTTALYSSEDIGAVGPVTNSAAYYTALPVNYETLQEMHDFSREFNLSDSSKWEERLKLIGYCMLIRKEAVNKVGFLDERFTPGNFEDDDYSLRLRKAGYKLLICKDTFIHHYGSMSWKDNLQGYNELLSENEKKFHEKWGTTSNSYIIHKDLIDLIEEPIDKPLQVLHIGCQAGGTLLEMKNKYKSSNLFGIESNCFAMKEVKQFADVTNKYAWTSFKENTFDLIIYTDFENPFTQDVLSNISYHLKEDGLFVAKFSNISYHQNIKYLLAGENPVSNHEINFYGLEQLKNMFQQYGFNTAITGVMGQITQQEQEFIAVMENNFGSELKSLIEIYQFIVKGKKINKEILRLIENISESENQILIKQSLIELNTLDFNEIILAVTTSYENYLEKLHLLAITNFDYENHDSVLPFLQVAYEKSPEDKDTLYNLAFILYSYGENQLASQYLQQIKDKDEEILQLLEEIKNDEQKSKQDLVFVLRRIEFDIDYQESLDEIIGKAKEGYFTEQDILTSIDSSIINKVKVLQAISISCFENQMHDYVLPFLNKAYELDKDNYDTLYNLGYVLLYYGENKLAKAYLDKIVEKDENILELLSLT